MADMQVQLPFTVWDMLGAVIHQVASLAGSVWGTLTPGLRLAVIAMLVLAFLLPPAKATAPVRRNHRRRRFRRRWDE